MVDIMVFEIILNSDSKSKVHGVATDILNNNSISVGIANITKINRR